MFLLDVSRLIWRRWAGRLPTGIDRVCLAYLEQFGPEALAVIQRRGWRRVLDRDASQQLFTLLLAGPPDFRKRLVRLAPAWPWQAAPRPQVAGKIYLNIGHTGLDDPGLTPWVQSLGLKAVYFIHDLIPMTHPEYCRPGEEERHARRMLTVLESATGVIGNSRQTVEDLSRWAALQGMAMPPSLAALLGCELGDEVSNAGRADGGPQPPSFVVVGTIEGRKNHLMLLQAWARLAAQLGDQTPTLKIVGQRGWESEQATDMLDRAKVLRGHVEELGRCSDAQLRRILEDARALLFPSFAEGYGLPLAEALLQRTPVIASDLPVFREIGGDIPLYLDPLDGPAWIDAIIDFTADGSRCREAQLDRLRNYHAPTWPEHFDAVRPWLGGLERRVLA